MWTLQHVLSLKDAVRDIEFCVVTGGTLFVVNNLGRVVPTDGGWINDGQDVHATILDNGFDLIERGELEGDEIAPGSLRDDTFWAAYRKTA